MLGGGYGARRQKQQRVSIARGDSKYAPPTLFPQYEMKGNVPSPTSQQASRNAA